MKKLLKIREFARTFGVHHSTVQGHVKPGGRLHEAYDGKTVDAAHACVTDWLESLGRRYDVETETGLDPLHEAAVAKCREAGRWSRTAIQNLVGVKPDRAQRILDGIVALGLNKVPEKPKRQPPPRAASVVTPPRPERAKLQQEHSEIVELPENIEAVADLTLRELIEKFGTSSAFLDFLRALKSIEDIHEKRLKNSEKEGTLVSREIVKNGIIDTINTTHQRMLTDGAKTIAVRARAAIEAGASLVDVEDMIADQIGSFIRPCKSKMQRVFNNV